METLKLARRCYYFSPLTTSAQCLVFYLPFNFKELSSLNCKSLSSEDQLGPPLGTHFSSQFLELKGVKCAHPGAS